ncbi:hypothetical protein [Chryseobacterium sp.]|uniref:hypothetical protein n=1 Tax=Chryseobacterium sp. TaxID=1871047 RepID=UPI0028A1E74F|nr:hypothetical protein [Chryseobacterium sp.]
MKAKDLRIGNLLRDKVSKTELEVTELTRGDIVTYVIDRSKYPLKEGWAIEPIPLTEEWLLKFGLKGGFKAIDRYENKILRIDFNSIQDLALWISEDEDTTNEMDTVFNLRNIKFVHQLQNLYFTLTGNELECN